MKSRLLPLAATALVALVVGACGSSSSSSTPSKSTPPPGTKAPQGDPKLAGKLSIVGVWTAEEQKAFQAVLDGFTKLYPKVTVKYNPAGDNTPTVLGTAIEGGNPPDLASVAQPGLIADFQKRGALKPIEFAREAISTNYSPDFLKLGEVNGKLYDFVFKGANKSTVWYNKQAFTNAGVTPPANWDAFLKDAKTLKASGTPAYSLGGADGWTLTDMFENVYLRQAGPGMYDKLTKHQIPFTDASVKSALKTMSSVLGDTSNIVGGKSGALQADFPTSVSNVFINPAKAAMVIEGDFVPGVVAGKTKLKAGSGFDVFPFPDIGTGTPGAVVGGGDSIVMFRDTPASQALVKFLASPDAAKIWAARGGFSSPNKSLDPTVYPDDITRRTAGAIAKAQTFRFDMSDLFPAAFGGTPGQGEWKILQDFLSNPSNVNGTASKLEAAATKAFKP